MLISFPWLTSIPLLAQQIAVVALWVGIILLIAWWLHSFGKAEPELVRKVVHIGTGNVILFAWLLDMPATIGITASIVASAVTLLSYIFPLLPGINSVGRRSFGTFFYAVSIGVLVAWFWHLQQPYYAAIGILIMAWGDGLAALIGKNFGKHKYKFIGSEKSWEGSLTMLLFSYLVCSLILFAVQGNLWQTWVVSLIVAIAATGLEAVSFLGIDNLTVPVGSAAICYFLWEIMTNNSTSL
ncbi:MAG: SEC59/DGK1/VTE5 family protein [Nostocaceae cyanobacterium]|nr:SEC59/DGK1/VTE5 family protein [Nostocaceae cyanobacterium]